MSYPANNEHGRILWHCPVCNDNGLISGWQNTVWDGLAAADSAHCMLLTLAARAQDSSRNCAGPGRALRAHGLQHPGFQRR